MHIIIIDCIVHSMMRRVKPASPCGSGVHTLGRKVCLQVPLQRVDGAVGAGEARCKVLWLAIINIEDKRARERQARRAQTGKRSDQPARLVEGQRVMGWREALNELDSAYPGRLK